jgi:hypothetical protein
LAITRDLCPDGSKTARSPRSRWQLGADREIRGPACRSQEGMGDSFTLERRTCSAPGCSGVLLFFVDAASVRPGERSRASCAKCGQQYVLRPDGTVEVPATTTGDADLGETGS